MWHDGQDQEGDTRHKGQRHKIQRREGDDEQAYRTILKGPEHKVKEIQQTRNDE